jgi:hypothetical protein
VKDNINHLEGVSGVAGIVKSILALEKGVIPPNTNFQKLNPRIKAAEHHLEFSTSSIPSPADFRINRASINSFGFGGANTHAVLDDAYSFLHARRIRGHHMTTPTSTMQNDYNTEGPGPKEQKTKFLLPFPGFSALNEEPRKRFPSAPHIQHTSILCLHLRHISLLWHTLYPKGDHTFSHGRWHSWNQLPKSAPFLSCS